MNKIGNWRVFRAWMVHLYTASGLLLALLATLAIARGAVTEAAVWLALAMVVDGTDGTLARAWHVRIFTPAFDGRKLDDITDFLTYTFVPIFFLYHQAILPGEWAWTLLAALLASAYGFCNAEAKTEDGFFSGFPSYWNVVALYFFWLQMPGWLAGSIVLILALMTFLPLKFISFNQTRQLRRLDRLLISVWVLLLLWLFLNFESPDRTWVWVSLFYPVFYFLASFYLQRKEISKKVKGKR